MYFETQIGKLSKVQINNLLKGKNVRVKKGTSHTINFTEAQLKKFHRNSRQGKALTIKLTHDQIAKQGAGLFGDLIGLVHPTAGKVANMVGLGMKKKKGKGFLGDLIGLVHPTAGKVANMVGLGMKKKKGKGILGDLANFALSKTGVQKKILGTGFLENMAKEAAINMAKSAGKFAIDKGADFAKGKIEGLGMRKKRRATPAQLEALARGRAIRDANRRGGALYPGGY
jgi:hypothetical protein